MSQHWLTNSKNRKVLFGSDKPTGGFFFTEFYRDDELTEDSQNDVVYTVSGLTIREFIYQIWKIEELNAIAINVDELINDWLCEPTPTTLQFNISLMFGKDLVTMLQRTNNDLYGFINA